MALFQTLPLAVNYWRGNQFVPAPVEWAPRPKPLYDAAVNTQSPTGQQSPAQQALGLGAGGDYGFQGGQPESKAGVGMNAVSPDFRSWAGSFTSPITALGSFGVQAVANALSGNPNRGINGLGLVDAVRAVGDAFGGLPGDSTLGSPQNPGPGNPSTPGAGDGDSPFDPIGTGEDSMGGEDSGWAYARGGKVDALHGPNPPGPDDGFGALDKGEHVINAKQAKKYRGLLEAINEGAPKKKLRGLLG